MLAPERKSHLFLLLVEMIVLLLGWVFFWSSLRRKRKTVRSLALSPSFAATRFSRNFPHVLQSKIYTTLATSPDRSAAHRKNPPTQTRQNSVSSLVFLVHTLFFVCHDSAAWPALGCHCDRFNEGGEEVTLAEPLEAMATWATEPVGEDTDTEKRCR